MKLIDEWRNAWRMFSVWMMSAAAVLQVAWTEQPELIRAVVPDSWVPYITAGLMVLGIAGRVVKQPTVSDPPKQ
jgi:hypothetical protein